MKSNNWIGDDIIQANLFASSVHLWMFPNEQPAQVREEEATVGVVRIGISVGVFVMYTMIATPLVDVALH